MGTSAGLINIQVELSPEAYIYIKAKAHQMSLYLNRRVTMQEIIEGLIRIEMIRHPNEDQPIIEAEKT